MQQHQANFESDEKQRKSRLIRIVMVHLLVVGGFFVATFIWGNFS